jgi:hypothetical protein
VEFLFAPSWVYCIFTTPLNFMAYIEYRRYLNFGKLVKTSSLEMKLSSSNLKLDHVLIQRKFGDIFKLSRPILLPNLMYFFGFLAVWKCVESLPWDPREGHWSPISFFGDVLFFRYYIKKGYLSSKGKQLGHPTLF